jgi:hypothetical protein
MKRPIRQCVKCGVVLRYDDILAAGPFSCPSCHTKLQAPDSYARWIGLGNLLFSTAVFRLLGFSDLHLLYSVMLAWLPVQYLAINLVKYAIPPKIEIYLPNDSTLRLGDGPHS